MKLEQRMYSPESGWDKEMNTELSSKAQLVLAFCPTQLLKQFSLMDLMKEYYPRAHVMSSSGHGEICGSQGLDEYLIITAVEFDKTPFEGASIGLDQTTGSFNAGEMLAGSIPLRVKGADGSSEEELKHILVFSDGMNVNGSELVKGISSRLPGSVTITGGLAGDAETYSETFVSWDEEPAQKRVAILGLYGSHIRIGCGSVGGWEPFGPERLVTRSKGNILHEFDGKSALALYKKYLGRHAEDLPASGHFFPLSFREKNEKQGIIRTINGIDEKDQSMIFAGDIPEGSYSRMMRTNLNRLIEGASEAARISLKAVPDHQPLLAVVISCAGRRIVLRQRFEEELESVVYVLGENTAIAGFYSYGEIAPFQSGQKSALHNQTMTITLIAEDMGD